ncbi:MAG TPA: amylo-alpha-1,6-glucosidase [Candidatus Elarobacter sp.]|jgi:predicted glycogen debranching enzyme|nr:amylo-alpha-1,6-glucosidase [Candidatus Elarobacter sp.]
MTTRELDRALCGELAVSQAREWLVTNGLGGFAAGTVAGPLTRRYHGLLFAARTPPVGRMLLCPKVDAEIGYDGTTYALATDLWHSGTLAPQGYRYLTGFRHEGSVPVWTFTCGDAQIERRVWMEQGANRTYVEHRVVRARAPVRVTLRAFVNYRDLHALTHAENWTMQVDVTPDAIRVVPRDGAPAIVLRADRGAAVAETPVWYRDFEYPVERERGLDDGEDHLRAGSFDAVLAAGASLTVAVADHDLDPIDAAAAIARRRARDDELLASWRTSAGKRAASAPDWIAPLVLAADQFVVARARTDDPDGRSVIAGYPWFADWGRDTAIALPGLALATGRPDVARAILRTFARFVDRGMLPNTFPEDGAAQYNTVDAALWYVHAVRRYFDATRDGWVLAEIYPALRNIVAAYTGGTRFGIKVDPADGLLRAGEPGVQLTWMDAKVGDWVVTPRIGKPVEVNALWIAALRACEGFATTLGHDPLPFASAARRAKSSFERFWNAQLGCCFDVLDGPDGDDASVRPNQIFAVSLPIDVLDAARRRAIVDLCAARLWTPAGLRSLDPRDPRYTGHYGGDQAARDAAYHQGTVWMWLAGPFVRAHRRVYGDAAASAALLDACATGLSADALGTLPEIADGDAPFAARGTFAQAWSVAALLDAWADQGATAS